MLSSLEKDIQEVSICSSFVGIKKNVAATLVLALLLETIMAPILIFNKKGWYEPHKNLLMKSSDLYSHHLKRFIQLWATGWRDRELVGMGTQLKQNL